MDEEKRAYIETQLNSLFKLWLGRVTLWGAVIFVSLGVMDYLITPDRIPFFFMIRGSICVFLLTVFLLVRKSDGREGRFHLNLAYAAVIASAVTIELMIFGSGGHRSPYYVGHILLGICVTGFIPAAFSFHLLSSLFIYMIYLLPILALDDIVDMPLFISANIFLVAVFSSMLILRYFSGRSLVNELMLKYDLQRHRDALERMLEEQVSRLTRTHEELKESESLYRSLFTQMLHGFSYNRIIFDEDGIPVDFEIMEVNRAFERMTGLEAADVKGRLFSNIAASVEETGPEWQTALAELSAEGRSVERKVHIESIEKWFHINAYSPRKGYFVAIMEDITDRHLMYEALKTSEQRLASFMDSATDSFVLFDSQLCLTEANMAALRLLGAEKSELVGTHITHLFPEPQEYSEHETGKSLLKKSGTSDRYLDVLRGAPPLRINNYYFMSRNGPRFLSLKAFRVGGGLGVIATDITERKRMEDQIRRDRQDWEDTFNAITDMITIQDMEFNIVKYNRAAEAMLGLQLAGKRDAKCFHHYHGTDHPLEECPGTACLRSGKPETREMYEPHLERFIEIRAIPRLDRNNRPAGVIHVVRDITERKRAEEQISRQYERLQSLRAIDLAITASLDLNHTLSVFLDQVTTQLGADAAAVLLVNSTSMVLEYAGGRGFNTDAIKYSRIRLGEGLAGKAARERRTVIVLDLESKKDLFTRYEILKEENMVSYFGVPIMAKGNVLGVLEIYKRELFEPDDDWIDFLGALSGQAAIAIDNARMFNELKDSHDNLVMAYETTIEGWARALDLRDRETEGHSRRVADLTVRVAREMKVSEEKIMHIHRGALLHDIGKIGVPDSILLKTSPLTDEEWQIMRRHPEIGHQLLSGIPFLRPALDIPYCHHERWDGTGYPRGLKGTEIPLAARIFAVVDHWDAMTSDRPYRPAMSDRKVREELMALSGKAFDPDVVEVFLRMKID